MNLYDSEYFGKIEKNTTIIDENYSKIIDFIGFYPKNFKLVLPKIKSIYDVLIWIHEYSHALFPEDSSEIFPNLMEAYYINMYIDDEEVISKLIEKTNLEIENSNNLEHTIAKKVKLRVIK